MVTRSVCSQSRGLTCDWSDPAASERDTAGRRWPPAAQPPVVRPQPMDAPISLPATEQKLFERSNPTFHRSAWHDQWFVLTDAALYVATVILWAFTRVQRFPLGELQGLNVVPVAQLPVAMVTGLYLAAAAPAIAWCVRVILGVPLHLWPPPAAVLVSIFSAYFVHLYRRSHEGRHALRISSSRGTFTVKSPPDTYADEKADDRKLLLEVVSAFEEARAHGAKTQQSV